MIRTLLSTWARLIAQIWRAFESRVILLLVLTVLASLADGASMALLLPLMTLVGVGSGAKSGVSSAVDRLFEWLGLVPSLEVVLAAIIGIFFVQGALVMMQGHLISSVESAYVSNWRKILLRRLLGTSWTYLSRQRSGSLAYLITTEAERLGRVFFLSVQLMASLVVVLAYAGIALMISWQFTLGVLACLGMLAAAFFRFSASFSYRIGRNYSAHLDELQATVTDFLKSAKPIKATAAEPYVIEKTRSMHAEIEKNYFGGVIVSYVLKVMMELAAIVFFCVLIYVGIRILEMSPAALLVLLAIFFRLVPKLQNAQYQLQLMLSYLPAFSRLEEVMADIDRMSENYPVDSRERSFEKSPSIRLNDVTVEYDGRIALGGVSLEIHSNTTVCVVGESGAGKSTLVDCIVGLATPASGEVLLDDTPLARVNLRQWRSSIGYVDQDSILFDGTVSEIICQGRAISRDAMVAAAQRAHAHVFICELPDAYDTLIGARGVQLSGGQRQRLALTRALAGSPVMLILDEPTSALDPVSEGEIATALHELHGSITIIIVSHSVSAVRDVDKFVVVQAGKIVRESSDRGEF